MSSQDTRAPARTGFGPRRTLALAAIAATAAAVALAFTAGRRQTAPSTSTPRTLTIAGEGEVQRNPDVAYVDVSVQTRGDTAAEATADNSRRMTAVLNAVRERGVSTQDLQTSGLYTQPQYDRGAPGP